MKLNKYTYLLSFTLVLFFLQSFLIHPQVSVLATKITIVPNKVQISVAIPMVDYNTLSKKLTQEKKHAYVQSCLQLTENDTALVITLDSVSHKKTKVMFYLSAKTNNTSLEFTNTLFCLSHHEVQNMVIVNKNSKEIGYTMNCRNTKLLIE